MPQITVKSEVTYDVADYGTPMGIDEIRSLVSRSGSHFFDRDTMRFFKSRVDYAVYTGKDGWYFVTSEKHVSAYLHINEPRLYTVRCLRLENYDGTPGIELYELENFQHYRSLNTARTAARHAAKHGAKICSACRLRLVSDPARQHCAECEERERKHLAADR